MDDRLMWRLIVNRFWQAALVLLALSLLVTALIGIMPGDPVDLMATSDPNLAPEDIARIRERFAVDQPILVRWWYWLGALLQGDFGYSRLYAKPVFEVIVPALVNSLVLLGAAFFLSLAIAVPLAVWAALNPYSWRDYSINLFAFAGVSIPAFWLSLMLIILFAVMLGWLPAGGSAVTEPDASGWASLRYLVLPVIALALASIGSHVRFMRGAMVEVLAQDYIRTARAKGVGATRLVLFHAMPNAVLPVVTVIALEFGALFSGALVVETVFSWPGMGKLIYEAIIGNDYAVALTALLLGAALTLLCNLLADLCYAWLDPRIRYR